MIKIPNWYSQDIVTEYVQEIHNEFPYNNIVFAQDADGNNISVNTYRLLTLPKNELFSQEPNAKLYFEIIKLVNYKNKKISEYCSDGGHTIYHKIRKEWVNNLIRNSGNDNFINQFIDKTPDYYKNQDTFKTFINQIENMLTQNLDNYLKKTSSKNVDKSFYGYMSGELRHKIISSLGVSVCPYCNRQYISTYYDDEDNAYTSADLDHFYPKSLFPLFSLSLFNFIPSCQICNHRKKAKFEEIVYPYDEEYGNDAVFALKSASSATNDYEKILKVLRGIEHDDISLILQVSDNEIAEKINKSHKMFNIVSIYQNHLKIAIEMKFKQQIYDEGNYLSLLKSQFKSLNFTQDDLNTFLYGYSLKTEEDINRPLSKMIRDILSESII